MKSRRNFFALASGLPLIGALFGSASVSATSDPTLELFQNARNCLLPALREFNDTDIELAIEIDMEQEYLLIVGHSISRNRTQRAAITKNDIKNRSYLEKFKHSAASLIGVLKLDDQRYARVYGPEATGDRDGGDPVLLVANPNCKVMGPALPGDGRELRTFHLSPAVQQRRESAEKAQS